MSVESSEPSLTARVARELAERIHAGEFKPGSRLTEVDLARTFSVSRTPVREALKIVAEQGLIEILPRRGAVVREGASAEDFAYHVEALRTVWGILAAAAATRARAKDVEELSLRLMEAHTAVEAGRPDYYDTYMAFYSEVERIAQLPAVSDLRRSGSRMFISMDRLAEAYRETAREELASMDELMEAVRRGDTRGARAIMEDSFSAILARPDLGAQRYFG